MSSSAIAFGLIVARSAQLVYRTGDAAMSVAWATEYVRLRTSSILINAVAMGDSYLEDRLTIAKMGVLRDVRTELRGQGEAMWEALQGVVVIGRKLTI